MNVNEEKQIMSWVYLTARQELFHTQSCIEKMQTYWRQLQKNGVDSLEFEVVMEELLQFEKTLHRLMTKIKNRMSEKEFFMVNQKMSQVGCLPEMKARAEHLKYQIHENRHGGIFAWELAKDLIASEEGLIDRFEQPW